MARSNSAYQLAPAVRVRIYVVAGLFVLGFAAILGRAFVLQVLQHERWQQRAEQQYRKVLPQVSHRGTIYDAQGQALAVSLATDSLYANPQRIRQPQEAARRLARVLDADASRLRRLLAKDKQFVWLQRQVSPELVRRVQELHIRGVRTLKEHKRYYPNGSLAAHVLGFSGLDPKGLEGLELEYDRLLLGGGGRLVLQQDARRQGLGRARLQGAASSPALNLHLSLDKGLQYVAQRELQAAVAKHKAGSGSIIVMDPRSGAVLAMASMPSYNPNNIQAYEPSQWRNRAVCDAYEPGSTFKVISLAAALDQGVVQPGSKIDCEHGSYNVGGKVIHDHRAYEKLPLAKVLKFSSNIGAAKLAQRLGAQNLYDYLRRFGFGRETGIDLPGERAGMLRPVSSWYPVDLATIAFGQGISITPLQLLRAIAAIANDGRMPTPYLLTEATNKQGDTVWQRHSSRQVQVIDSQVARTVTQLMVGVTLEGGTGTKAAIPGYRVAGKTGTAQKVDSVTGGYSRDRWVSSFVGFAPADNPRLAALVVINEPQDESYGGLVAAPVFKRVMQHGLTQRQVPATEPRPAPQPDPIAPLLEKAQVESVPRTPDVKKQASAGRMPSLKGMSLRQVLQVMERNGLNFKLQGGGRVVSQQPAAGASISATETLQVTLQPLAARVPEEGR